MRRLRAFSFVCCFDRCSPTFAGTYGRGAGVGRDLGVGVIRGVAVAVAVAVGVDVGVAVAVGVGVGVGVAPDCAQYLPPVFKRTPPPAPPQTIISLAVQTAV
jgi:hypothetical protein